MLRSLATTGALTMLIESISGASSPCSRQAVSGRQLSVATSPSYSITAALMAVSVIWPAKLPNCSASFM